MRLKRSGAGTILGFGGKREPDLSYRNTDALPLPLRRRRDNPGSGPRFARRYMSALHDPAQAEFPPCGQLAHGGVAARRVTCTGPLFM